MVLINNSPILFWNSDHLGVPEGCNHISWRTSLSYPSCHTSDGVTSWLMTWLTSVSAVLISGLVSIHNPFRGHTLSFVRFTFFMHQLSVSVSCNDGQKCRSFNIYNLFIYFWYIIAYDCKRNLVIVYRCSPSLREGIRQLYSSELLAVR